MWLSRAARTGRTLNQSAVAKVIERYLWDSGERSDNDTSTARAIKDRVSRALRGSLVSPETLEWFMGAFEFTDDDSTRLMEARFGGTPDGLSVVDTLKSRRAMVEPQRHRTLSLFERYTVTRQRLASRVTAHTIIAVAAGVGTYIFNHEPYALRIEVVHGGTLGRRFEYGQGLRAVEIVLDRRLHSEQSTCMEYQTHYGESDLPTCEVRRAAYARATNIDLAVRFIDQVPRRAWWCAWQDHLNGGPVMQNSLEIEHASIHQYFTYVETRSSAFDGNGKWIPMARFNSKICLEMLDEGASVACRRGNLSSAHARNCGLVAVEPSRLGGLA
jgi:hypothetical protein